MYERRSFEQWNHTAKLLQLITNVNRNTDEYPDELPLEEFHPLMKSSREEPATVSISEVRGMMKSYGIK